MSTRPVQSLHPYAVRFYAARAKYKLYLAWSGCRFSLTLMVIACALSAPAAVIQCQDDAGRTHFQQFDCPPDTRLIPPDEQAEPRLSVIVTVPLSPEEERALDQLQRSLAKARNERAKQRARSARERSARAEEDARRCREANRKLTELAETRRRGYRATAEARLETEEARWRDTRKSTC
jgi:hypothetical protein